MINPRMLTVTLTAGNTNYRLSTLLAALDTEFGSQVYTRAARVRLQADVNGGGAKYYIGNSDLSATNCGRELIATQLQDLGTTDLGIVDLTAIYLRSDTEGAKLNVIVEFS